MKKFYILLIALAHFGVLRAQTHFTPDFEGNGFDHMNIFVVESVIEGADMQAGDEIAVFDGAVCAGVFVLNEALTDGSIGLVNASKADQDTSGAYLSNGYTPGNALSFKLWDASHGIEYEDVDITFVDNQSGEEVDPVPFTVGASVFVRVIVDYPCMFEVYPNTLSIDSLGEEVFAPIITYHAWEVTAAPDWILFDNPSGFGSDTLNINISVNHGVDRSGVIELEGCDGLTESISVEQEGPEPCTIVLGKTYLARDTAAYFRLIGITCNSDWVISDHPDWITFSEYSGSGDGVVTAYIAKNIGDPRTGVATFTTCDDVSATITVDQEGIQICEIALGKTYLSRDAAAYSRLLGVTATSDWVITDSPDWITFSETSGTGNAVITIYIAENTGAPRTGVATFTTCDDVSATITVDQEGIQICEIALGKTYLSRDAAAYSRLLGVTATSDWVITDSPDWITFSETSGTGNAVITIYIAENTGAPRTGVATFTTCDDVSATITVDQEGIQICEIALGKTYLSRDAAAYSRLLGVTATSDWVITDSPDWITFSETSGTGNAVITIYIAENTGAPRTGVATFTTCDDVSATITVDQEGIQICEIALGKTYLSRDAAAYSRLLGVTATSDWVITDSPDWITFSETSGTGDAVTTIYIAENTGTPRTGVATFTTCDDVSATITVDQEGIQICEIALGKTYLSRDAAAYSRLLGVTATSDWVITDSPDWITFSETSGTGDAVTTIYIAENTGTPRTGVATFTTCDDVSATITVDQEGVQICEIALGKTYLSRDAAAYSRLLGVTATSDWVITDSPDWITFSETSGTGNAVITIYIAENTGAPRTGVATFTTCDDVSTIITVDQDGPLKSAHITTDFGELVMLQESKIYPNPFNEKLYIEFTQEDGENISLYLYDRQGKMIRVINEEIINGLNRIEWDATDGNGSKVKSGMYLIQLQSDLRIEKFKVIYQEK
ncbi:BACON domain-containing carbohydrate-binding protein [uncultured Draconibacterium sp.]|uniref:BACON domain-containing protein n=1 Tax=uncultured Draconibacterium sp. TaxID=1573823 RepID=UPI003217592E